MHVSEEKKKEWKCVLGVVVFTCYKSSTTIGMLARTWHHTQNRQIRTTENPMEMTSPNQNGALFGRRFYLKQLTSEVGPNPSTRLSSWQSLGPLW